MIKTCMEKFFINVLLILIFMTAQETIYPQINTSAKVISLSSGWFIQSSEKVMKTGAEISSPQYPVNGWFETSVPSTIMGSLIKNKVYSDVFVGDNLKNIPTDQFKKPWWYRKEFSLTEKGSSNVVNLEFDGIIYRANIWLNGRKIADADSAFGVYRRFKFDVSGMIHKNGKNILAVEVFPAKPGEPSIGFVDWNPKSPDNNMGIWRPVKLKVSGNVSIDYPFVKSEVNLETLKSAALTVSTELRNYSDKKISGTLTGKIGTIKFSKKVTLDPDERSLVTFSPKDYKQLVIKNPKLWWTYNLGKPVLYDLELSFSANDKIYDISNTKFGIRTITDYINEDGYRGYKLNGRKILILGGGWVDNIFLDNNSQNLKNQVEYIKQMGLNAVRLEGIWGTSDDLYNLCDENGILMMVGWSCQWEWDIYIGKPVDDYGGIQTPGEIKLISRSWEDQIKWLRNHPSIFVWLYGSDKYPRPELEEKYLEILKKYDPDRPHLAAAKQLTSPLSGPTGVKMKGPYDYIPPAYWWIDKENGGAFGFNTEVGPGAEIPPLESIKKMIPKDHLWPIDSVWDFHCGKNDFGNLKNFNAALFNRLGTPNNLDEYCTKAQCLNYEATRSMFEAHEANRYKATGVIHWMLNSAWPKLWWQLYDYYLMPGGAFYGVKKACEPVHLLYDYGNSDIIALNNTTGYQKDLTAKIRVLNFDLTEKFSKDTVFNISPDEHMNILRLPEIVDLSKTYFIDLKLFSNGKLLSSNFYFLSTKNDVLDTAKTTWILTPTKEYADLTELNGLEKVHLTVKQKFTQLKEKDEIETTVSNNTNKLAFQIVLSVHKGETGNSVLPIFWEDNYFSLLPGEQRKVKGYFYKKDLEGNKPVLKVSGWNIN